MLEPLCFPVAEGASTEICFTGGEIAATGANNNLLWLFLVIFLVFAILAFFWLRRRCRQLENDLYEVRLQLHHAHAALVTANLQADTATGSLDALNRRANVLAIMHEL